MSIDICCFCILQTKRYSSSNIEERNHLRKVMIFCIKLLVRMSNLLFGSYKSMIIPLIDQNSNLWNDFLSFLIRFYLYIKVDLNRGTHTLKKFAFCAFFLKNNIFFYLLFYIYKTLKSIVHFTWRDFMSKYTILSLRITKN